MTDQRHRPHEDQPHVVYTMYGHDGAALYVGATSNLAIRIRDHRKDKPWWGDVAEVRHTAEMSWEDALRVEQHLIKTKAPVHNKRRRNGSRYIDLGIRDLIAAERAERAARKAAKAS